MFNVVRLMPKQRELENFELMCFLSRLCPFMDGAPPGVLVTQIIPLCMTLNITHLSSPKLWIRSSSAFLIKMFTAFPSTRILPLTPTSWGPIYLVRQRSPYRSITAQSSDHCSRHLERQKGLPRIYLSHGRTTAPPTPALTARHLWVSHLKPRLNARLP